MRSRILRGLIAAACCATSITWGGSVTAGPRSPDKALTSSRTSSIPVFASTNFDAALRCMDELLLRNKNFTGVYLVPKSLTDPSEKLGEVTKDMIIDAASRMSERSHLFLVLAKDPEKDPDGILIVVQGSVSELDEAVVASGKDLGGGIGDTNGLGGSRRKQAQDTVLGISLYFTSGDGIVLPGTFQNVRVVLSRSDRGGYMTVSLLGAYGTYGFDVSRSDGTFQAVKALIQLAMIQAVGGWAQAPVGQCLAMGQTDPLAIQDARLAFDKLKPDQRLSSIADGLQKRGFLTDGHGGRMDSALRGAISAFQASRGESPMGLPTFDVYYALNSDKFGAPSATPLSRLSATETSAVRVAPIGAGFETMAYPTVTLPARVGFSVTVAEPSYVACFYTDGQNRTSMIFPNAQRPKSRLLPGDQLRLPGDGDIYAIKPEHPDTEEAITCLAAPSAFLEQLPEFNRPLQREPLLVKDAETLVAIARRRVPGLSSDILKFDACSAITDMKDKEHPSTSMFCSGAAR